MFPQRLKLQYIKPAAISELRRFVCSYKSNYELLSQFFGLPHAKAKQYISDHRLSRIEPESIMKTVKYFEEVGFDPEDLLKYPILLRANPSCLDQYYLVMVEGGFKAVTPVILAKFRTLYRKSIAELKEADLIDCKTDVAQNFVKYLKPCPDNFSEKLNISDAESWSDVHLEVLSLYLKWRLKATDADIARLVTIHRGIHRKSFRYLCENIAFAEELGFTPEKMFKYGYILHAYPKYTKAVLEKFPEIAGASMRRAMRMYPKLITVSPSNVEKIYEILKEHDIPDLAIQKRMNVFHLSPETVKLRLEELERVSDFKVLLHNPNVLKLVVHHNRAKSRLEFMKQLQLRCTGVSVLGNDDIKFDIHVREGRDANTATDIYAFLKGLFGKDVKQFEGRLKRHPYYLQVPLVAMEETYNYLKAEKFASSALFDVIYILLYPKEKIVNALKQLKDLEQHTKKVLTQVNKLNLMLYFIEKEHHFTGDGIWSKSEILEESGM